MATGVPGSKTYVHAVFIGDIAHPVARFLELGYTVAKRLPTPNTRFRGQLQHYYGRDLFSPPSFSAPNTLLEEYNRAFAAGAGRAKTPMTTVLLYAAAEGPHTSRRPREGFMYLLLLCTRPEGHTLSFAAVNSRQRFSNRLYVVQQNRKLNEALLLLFHYCLHRVYMQHECRMYSMPMPAARDALVLNSNNLRGVVANRLCTYKAIYAVTQRRQHSSRCVPGEG